MRSESARYETVAAALDEAARAQRAADEVARSYRERLLHVAEVELRAGVVLADAEQRERAARLAGEWIAARNLRAAALGVLPPYHYGT